MEQVKITFASVPSRARSKLAEAVAERLPEEVALKDWDLFGNPNYKDANTDWRWLVKIAAVMVTYKSESDLPVLHTDSVLDCLIHATLAIERHARFQNVTEYERNKWLSTFAIIAFMFRESFDFGHVIFLDMYDDDLYPEQFEVQKRIELVLKEFGIPYTKVMVSMHVDPVEKWIDDVTSAVRGVINGQGNDSIESDEGED